MGSRRNTAFSGDHFWINSSLNAASFSLIDIVIVEP